VFIAKAIALKVVNKKQPVTASKLWQLQTAIYLLLQVPPTA
jgi:hypothetical protein